MLHRPHLAEPLAAIGRPLAQVIADYVAAVEIVGKRSTIPMFRRSLS